MSAPATRIGPYRLLTKLGQGGMGTVWRAQQEALGREVALKVVLPQYAADGTFRERFLREAQAMARLSSPFVVSCYDAGQADGQLYMALELVSGGDLLGLLKRKGGRLEELMALGVLRDALEGLEALEAARLVHRDLKPANLFLTDRGQAKLADLGLVRQLGGDQLSMPGMIMGTPAYIAPEQAKGESVDVRSDLFSLGATLFHLVTGGTAFHGDTPMTTLVMVINDPVPDPRSRRPDLHPGVVDLIGELMAKDPARRPPSARAARERTEAVIAVLRTTAAGTNGISPIRTPLPMVEPNPARSVASLPTTPSPRPASPPAAPPSGRPPSAKVAKGDAPVAGAIGNLDAKQLLVLSKRIVVDQGGLRASLALAPGASFPRALLDQLLAVSGITYGLIDENLSAAGRPGELPRRILLAKGDPPAPDAPGRTVRNEVVPPLADALAIRIAEDAMTAWVLYRPHEPPTAAELRQALATAGVRHGIDETALNRFPGHAPKGGKATIAKGSAMRAARVAGFHLAAAVPGDDDSIADGIHCLALSPVQPGQVLAKWSEAESGVPGRDVLGREIPAPETDDPEPEHCVGAGTEIGRDRDGDLVLRATRSGVVQRQPDGTVRVVGVVEIPNDLTADAPPVVTDDVVVVRGNVLSGASITSTSDVVILGNVEDARIDAGGHVEISGSLGPGQDLRAAGTVTAADATGRRILAGSVRIQGLMRNCDLTATGNVEVDCIEGGSLSAGGDIRVGRVGSSGGVPTLLWAGHHQMLDQQSQLIRLQEVHHESRRNDLVQKGQTLKSALDDLDRKRALLAASQYVNPAVAASAKEALARLSEEHAQLSAEAEDQRQAILNHRRKREGLAARNGSATISIGQVAYEGVSIRVANRDPLLLTEPRVRFTV